jgi:Tol biopolymer transport system component
VPVLGGAPQPFLPNASGLTWLDEQRLVYSSIDAGSHMGIVTSSPTRTEARSIYFPASRAGMAHRSTPSPDRGSLLVVEMDQGTWQPCRLVPVDGSSAGTPVGPQNGQCTSAAWSPDGRWMYFSSNAGGAYHIWRQRHPDGTPVQLTFGPTEQEGTAITPDGQYLITSMGLHRAAVSWHDSSGERALTEEGFAMVPSQPASGRRLYYLMRTEGSQGQASGELWALDLDTRRRQRLFPGVVMGNYSLSHDGRQVVFTSTGASAGDGVWVADLERRTPPRQLTRNREPRAFFGAPGEIVVMSADGYLRRMRDDGSAQETISPDPIVYLMTVSPDGRWAAVITRATADGRGTAAEFRSLRGETSLAVCNERCSLGPRSLLYSLPFTWSADGRQLFVDLGLYGGRDSRTVVLPYKSGASLDALWPRGLTLEADVAANPGARVLESDGAIFPAADPTAYLVWRQSFQSNLYRLRLPP